MATTTSTTTEPVILPISYIGQKDASIGAVGSIGTVGSIGATGQIGVSEATTSANGSIKVINYTAKTCVVIGDTYKYRDLLKQHKGRWTPHLLQLPGIADKGWMFPIAKKAEIERLVANFPQNIISSIPETRISAPKITLKSSTSSTSSVANISSTSSPQISGEQSELISYNKTVDKRDDHTTETTITQIEDHIRDGKKVRVTTTTITRTEELN